MRVVDWAVKRWALRAGATAALLCAVSTLAMSPAAIGVVKRSPLLGSWRGTVIGFSGEHAYYRVTVTLLVSRVDLGAIIGTLTWPVGQNSKPGQKPCVESILLSRRLRSTVWDLIIAKHHGTCAPAEGSWTYRFSVSKARRLRLTAWSSAPRLRSITFRGMLLRTSRSTGRVFVAAPVLRYHA
jgi:hypothetical protein